MISPSGNEKIIVANDGFAEGFVALAADIKNGECGVEEGRLLLVQSFLERIYEDLEKSGFEFAYRTVKEIRQYLAVSFELKKDEFNKVISNRSFKNLYKIQKERYAVEL